MALCCCQYNHCQSRSAKEHSRPSVLKHFLTRLLENTDWYCQNQSKVESSSSVVESGPGEGAALDSLKFISECFCMLHLVKWLLMEHWSFVCSREDRSNKTGGVRGGRQVLAWNGSVPRVKSLRSS